MLVRGPGDGLDSRGMITKFPERRFAKFVPDHQFVVVAARCELPVLSVPVQTADFLFVADEFAEVLFRLSYVTMIDEPVPRARGENMIVPG